MVIVTRRHSATPRGEREQRARVRTRCACIAATLAGLLVYTGASAQPPVFVDRAAEFGLIDEHGAADLPRFFESMLEEAYFINHGSGGAVVDVDGDGDLDVVVAGYPGEADRIWLNQLTETGDLSFVRETLPTSAAPWRRSVGVADFDGDGQLDLLLHGDGFDDAPGTLLLLRTAAGGWRQETVAAHIGEFAQTFALVADLGGDGRPWVLTGAWALQLPGEAPLEAGSLRLFRCGNTVGSVCREEPILANEESLLQGNHYNAVLADLYTEEGGAAAYEVFIANDFQPNRLFSGRGGAWQDVAGNTGLNVDGANMGVAVADFDDDGDLDLYTTEIVNQVDGISTEYATRFFVRDGDNNTYVDEAALRGVLNTDWGWSAFFADLNHDSRLDLVIANGAKSFSDAAGRPHHPVGETPNIVFLQQASGNFARLADPALDAENETRALIPADIDRDGDLDLIELNYRGPFRVLINESNELPPALHLLLEPPVLARGAILRVDLGGRQLRRDIVAGEGYLSQRPDELHVALPSGYTGDFTAELTWRDGHRTTLLDLPHEGIYRISYPRCDDVATGSACGSSPAWTCFLTDEDETECMLSDSALSWQAQYTDAPSPTEPSEPDGSDVGLPSSSGKEGCSTSGNDHPRAFATLMFLLLFVWQRRRAPIEEGGAP